MAESTDFLLSSSLRPTLMKRHSKNRGRCYIEEILVIPVLTMRKDTVLIGKSKDGNAHLYTFVDNLWEERVVPKCRRSSDFNNVVVNLSECIGGSRKWSGATYIDTTSTTGTNPSLVFADRHFPGELYHITLSMRTIAKIRPSVNQNMLNQLETYWNNLKKSLKASGEQAKSSSPVPSLCGASSQVDSMFQLLSEIKLHLSSTDCSSESSSFEERRIVYDEAPPVETATITSEITTPSQDLQQSSVATAAAFTSSTASSIPSYATGGNPRDVTQLEVDNLLEDAQPSNQAPLLTPELGSTRFGRQELDVLGRNDDIPIS